MTKIKIERVRYVGTSAEERGRRDVAGDVFIDVKKDGISYNIKAIDDISYGLMKSPFPSGLSSDEEDAVIDFIARSWRERKEPTGKEIEIEMSAVRELKRLLR